MALERLAMKRFGLVLMWAGVSVGVVTALATVTHVGLSSVPWLVNVALAKLAFIGAGGLMAGGAVVRRLAIRQEAKRLGRPN